MSVLQSPYRQAKLTFSSFPSDCGQKCSEADQARRASQGKPLPQVQVQHKRPLSTQEDKPGMMDTLREKFSSSGPKRDKKPKTRADEKAQWVTSPAFKEPEVEMCEVHALVVFYKWRLLTTAIIHWILGLRP